jgi:hypothetical protein
MVHKRSLSGAKVAQEHAAVRPARAHVPPAHVEHGNVTHEDARRAGNRIAQDQHAVAAQHNMLGATVGEHV